jgi:phosphoglycolate phosphatase-like HAD superfamily hydrolase
MRLRPSEVETSDEQPGRDSSTGHSSAELKTGWAGAENIPAGSRCSVHIQPRFDWTAADAYLFDIDGTLLNSRDAVHYHAFHRAIAQVFGLDFRIDGVPVHGNTDVGILRAYLEVAEVPESTWSPRLPEVLELMSVEVERNSADLRPELCPAVLEVIQELSNRDKLLGIASGNLERVGWAKLRACGIRDYFSFGAFSGTLEKRDHVIAHGIQQAREIRGSTTKVCVVGDTPADIRSAHTNSIPAIAVATGIYSFDELLGHEPEMCVSCCEELLRSHT